MKTAGKDEPYRRANMTGNTQLLFQIWLTDAETGATTWSLADKKRVTIQLECEIYCITLYEQKRLKKECSILLIELIAPWETFGILALQKTIAHRVIHFGYIKMLLVSHISQSIHQMGSGDNFTTDISERLNITHVKEAFRPSNKVNYIRPMLKHIEQCPGLDYIEKTLSYLALQGWYDTDSAKVLNLLSATDKRHNTHGAHLLCLQMIQDEPCICPVSQHVYYLRDTHVRGACRSIKLLPLRDASEDFKIPNFGQLFCAQIEEDWGHKVCGLGLGYDQNVLIASICITLQNGLLYDRQPIHNRTSVGHLGLDCKVENTNTNQGIMPEAHNICVQYMQSEENDLNNTFRGRIISVPGLYFSWTPPNWILHFPERLTAGKAISTFSRRCKITQYGVLYPQIQEYMVVIPTKFKDLHGWADCVDGFIRVVKQMNKMHIVSVGAILGPAHLVREYTALGSLDCVLLVNNHVHFDPCWTIY